jgi:hypothetical protein
MTFKEAIASMKEDDSFRATVYAMNALLIKKGVYKSSEFEQLFCEYAINHQRGFRGAKSKAETSHAAAQASL